LYVQRVFMIQRQKQHLSFPIIKLMTGVFYQQMEKFSLSEMVFVLEEEVRHQLMGNVLLVQDYIMLLMELGWQD